MPYDGEFAGYNPLRRVVETERVQQLLRRARSLGPSADPANQPTPRAVPATTDKLPDFVLAVDGSYAEVDVRNGYPGAKVGYVTVASVLIDLAQLDRLDEYRPVDPREFRKSEKSATIDAALPGTNVVTRDHAAARHAFRETVFDVFHDSQVDDDDPTRLLDTFHALLVLKPQGRGQSCPYASAGCDQQLAINPGLGVCGCPHRRPIYSTDALRIHERFFDFGPNGEAFGLVMGVWERVLLIHFLRCFERLDRLKALGGIAFFLDGPLATFGPPAWLSAAISCELQRLNAKVRATTGTDLLIVGVEKTGAFVDHFEEVDRTDRPGEPRFGPSSYLLLTDQYIKRRVVFSDSDKRYGADTYFGRKFLYKTRNEYRVVANIPFLTAEQDTLDTDEPSAHPRFASTCRLLDKLVSARFPNALAPLVTAHAHAGIPLHLGAKVLQQLARALMREE